MMRIVLDTNVLISATLWDGSVAQKLLYKAIRAGTVISCSRDILAEYERILRRDFDYPEDELAHIIAKVLCFMTIIEPGMKVKAVKEDPDDDKIVECALASSSGCIITYDKHLLHLHEFEGIRMMTPEEALRLL